MPELPVPADRKVPFIQIQFFSLSRCLFPGGNLQFIAKIRLEKFLFYLLGKFKEIVIIIFYEKIGFSAFPLVFFKPGRYPILCLLVKLVQTFCCGFLPASWFFRGYAAKRLGDPDFQQLQNPVCQVVSAEVGVPVFIPSITRFK